MGAFSWTLDTVWIRIEQNVCGVTTNPQSGVTSDVCVLVFVPPWVFQGSPRRGWKFAWWWDREGCKGEFAVPLVINSYCRMLSSAIEVRGSQNGPLWTCWPVCLLQNAVFSNWGYWSQSSPLWIGWPVCAFCRMLSSVIEVRGSQTSPFWPVRLL